MASFIEELYYGNINPNAKQFNLSSQYAKAMKTFCNNEKALTEKLSGDNLDLFNDLINAHDEITATSDIENFKLGFRLGVQMICDSLVFDESKIFRDITEE